MPDEVIETIEGVSEKEVRELMAKYIKAEKECVTVMSK